MPFPEFEEGMTARLSCCAALYPDITNSPLAEQKNAVLRQLEGQLAYMNQITALLYTRLILHCMNRQQDLRNQGKLFYAS